jgi:hypothetical protein
VEWRGCVAGSVLTALRLRAQFFRASYSGIARADNSRDNKRPAISFRVVGRRGNIPSYGHIGQFEPVRNEVEGLVTRIGRGGSNPLGRTEKPWVGELWSLEALVPPRRPWPRRIG